jgi:sugar lactone lactonase YvrE
MKTIATILSLHIIAAAALFAAESDQFVIKDEAEFKKLVAPDAKVTKLGGDMGFLEGPTWHPEGYLVFSDIPANELKKWTAEEGITTFRKPSGNANGNTIDLQGRLVTAEHSNRRISVIEKDGKPKPVVSEHEGKKFNSPNDVVVKSDGTLWFTDPPYGLPRGQQKEMAGNFVFRFDPRTSQTSIVAKDTPEFDRPNGLAFSPDEQKLYVANSGTAKAIRVFDVKNDGTLGEGKIFAKIDKGGPDGIRVDTAGRVWSSAGDGVHVFAPVTSTGIE